MNNRVLIALGSAALALMPAGCGPERSAEGAAAADGSPDYTIDRDSGETRMTVKSSEGTASVRSGANVPVSLPAGFSLFPGSRVTGNTVVNHVAKSGTMVMFESDAAPREVIAHFRQQARAAGFALEIDADMNGAMIIGGTREQDGIRMSITASADADTVTTGQIVFGIDKSG